LYFYEKVIKVKADVAALLFSPTSLMQRPVAWRADKGGEEFTPAFTNAEVIQRVES